MTDEYRECDKEREIEKLYHITDVIDGTSLATELEYEEEVTGPIHHDLKCRSFDVAEGKPMITHSTRTVVASNVAEYTNTEDVGKKRTTKETDLMDAGQLFNNLFEWLINLFYSFKLLLAGKLIIRAQEEEGTDTPEKDYSKYDYDRMVVFHSAPLAYLGPTGSYVAFPFHDFDEEKKLIKDSAEAAFDITKHIDVTFQVATVDGLEEALGNDASPILHFSCHGHEDYLYIESGREWGLMELLKKENLKRFVQVGKKNLQVVFIAACHSGAIGQAFLDAGVPHVVCCPTKTKLRHASAMEFARSFYRSLALERTLKEAVNLAREKVLQSSSVKHAEEESKKFLLLPEKPDDDPYHDVKVFYTRQKRRPFETRRSSYVVIRILPPAPQAFRGRNRELEMFRVLTEIRTKRIIELAGPFQTERSVLARAVCNYVLERSRVCFFEDIFWVDDSFIVRDDTVKYFLRVLHILERSPSSGDDSLKYDEYCERIIGALHVKRALVFIQAKHMNSNASMKKLGKFLRTLTEHTKHLQFVVICPPDLDLDQKPKPLPGLIEAKEEKIVDAYFAFQYPSTKFDKLDTRPRRLFSLKQLSDSIREYQKYDETIKYSSFIITDGRKEDLKNELKSASSRLLVWCGEGIDQCGGKDQSNLAPLLGTIAKRKPEVVIICLKYGAEYAAKMLHGKGVETVIWLRMDPFYKDAKAMFDEMFYPFCKLFLTGEAKLIKCFKSLKENAAEKGGCNECAMIRNWGIHKSLNPASSQHDRQRVKLITNSCCTSPWFLSREVRSLKLKACDYSLLDDSKDFLYRQSAGEDHSYLFLRPHVDFANRTKKARVKACERARAASLYVCNDISGNSSGMFNGGIYLVSSESDKVKVQEAIDGRTDSALLWVDFKRGQAKPVFECAQDLHDWVESIGQNTTIAVILSCDERHFRHFLLLEEEMESVGGKSDHIILENCASGNDVTMSNLIGFIRILPLKTGGILGKQCVLDKVPCHKLHEALVKTLFSENESDLDKQIKLYRDDDFSVQVRLCVSDFKYLTRLRDLILMGVAAESLQKSFPSLLDDGHSIEFDRSAMAFIYESLILRLESLTDHQQQKLEECEGKKRVHIEAPAGSGKTFVALNSVVDFLDKTRTEKVLFVCRNNSLAIHFVKWLCYRFQKEFGLNKKLEKVYTLSDDGSRKICSYQYNRRNGALDISTLNDHQHLSFGKIVVDDAHDIFGRHIATIRGLCDKVQAIVESHQGELMVLSDGSQASVSSKEIIYPDDLVEVRLTEVCRNSKRIVAGALAYQLGDTTHISCAHDSDGLPLSPILFKNTGSAADERQRYADEIIAAIADVCKEFPGLDLHDRLAIIVPDEAFRDALSGGTNSLLESLLKANEAKFGQNLVPKTALEASLSLNLDDRKREESWIIVDCIDHMEGLERLIVLGVGLDESFDDNKTSNAVVRSRIYRAITRAHLVYYLINKRIHGGWFEFIENLEYEGKEFSLQDEIRKTASNSASTIIREESFEMLAHEDTSSCNYQEASDDLVGESGRSFNTKEEHNGTSIKQSTWAVKRKLRKQDRCNPIFMPFISLEDESGCDLDYSEQDEDNASSQTTERPDPLNNMNTQDGNKPPPIPERTCFSERVSSFRDVLVLNSESQEDIITKETLLSPGKISPTFVVKPVFRPYKSMGDLQLEADNIIKEGEDEDEDDSGAVDAMDYYFQKEKGALARLHRVRLRPDEAKRKETILERKEIQKQKQQRREAAAKKKVSIKETPK